MSIPHRTARGSENISTVAIPCATEAVFQSVRSLGTYVPPRPRLEILPRREVNEWLFALVKGKTVLVVEIQREAAARGYSWSRVKRAKTRLRIDTEKLDWGKGWPGAFCRSDSACEGLFPLGLVSCTLRFGARSCQEKWAPRDRRNRYVWTFSSARARE